MPSERDKVGGLLGDLTELLARQQGYIGGSRLESEGAGVRAWPAGFPAGLLGRVTLWDSEADADRSAQTEPVVSVRSQLNSLVVDHQEYAFYGTDVPSAST